MQKAFRNVLFIALIGVVIFGLFSWINGNGKVPNDLPSKPFTQELKDGKLKTLEVQPSNNVYKVSGKLNNGDDYSSTILFNNDKELEQVTDIAKDQRDLEFTVKEEEGQS
ncbi:zinc metalloprotease, partial [Staphylococcus equorum]